MNRRTLLMGVPATVVIVGIWVFLVWLPSADSIARSHDQASTSRQQEQELRAKLAQLQTAKKNEAQLQDRVKELQAAIPDKDAQLPAFITQVNDTANASGVQILTFAPAPVAVNTSSAGVATAPSGSGSGTASPPPAPAGPNVMTVSLSASGSYPQLLDFITRMEKLPRLVVIDSVNLTSAGDGSKLSLQMNGKVFTTAAPAVKPASSTPGAPATSGTSK